MLYSGPWFTNKQHSGFQYAFSGVNLVIFKGASHQVPQSKRPESYQFFGNILDQNEDGSIWEYGILGTEKLDFVKQSKAEVVTE